MIFLFCKTEFDFSECLTQMVVEAVQQDLIKA